MTDEIRRAIYLLRGEGVLHGRIRSFEQDWCTQQADALEKLLAVFEAAQDVRYSNGGILAMSVLTDALNAVQTRRTTDQYPSDELSPTTAPAEPKQPSTIWEDHYDPDDGEQ